ncbi:MAG TPA: hypothetical protein VJ765_16275 [Chitinophagaceae bacterium]|nr:hypothetical protein [Chitinophagaceae bacterium]
MEVHRHLHTKRQKWTHYVWEFFMLFLAVFCGFLAEWQLERTIEHHREKQFIHSLVEDLKRDTAQLTLYMRFNKSILKYCDSAQHLIANTDIFKNSNSFYDYSRELVRFMRYYPTDRTMQQLKNAGNMRLIRNWNVSNAITAYDSETKLLTELDQQLNEQTIKYRNYLIEFFDLTSYDRHNPVGSFMDNTDGTKGNPGYINNDVKTAKMIYNQIFTLKMFFATVEGSAEALAEEGKQLLELLQKEYHFS